MTADWWSYALYIVALAVVFAGIIAYYFGAKRRDRIEAPKYRMLSDDGHDETEPADENRR
jgi:cbb3-type cytochrome oxidase subunit 3